MNIYSVSSLLASSFCLFLSVLVWFRGSGRAAIKSFALITSLAGFWTLFPFAAAIASNDMQALWLGRVIYFAAVFVPAAFLGFVFNLIEKKRSKIENSIIKFSYFLSGFFLLVDFTPLFIKGISRFHPQFYVIPGFLYPLFIAYFGTVCFYAFIELIFAFQISKGAKRNQLKYVFIAFVLAYISGLMHFLPAYLGKYAEPFPHDLLLIVFASIISYAILQHHLMDIEVVIKRGVVYSVLTSLLTGLFVSLILVSDRLFRGITGYSSIWPSIIGAFVIALIFQPLRELIQKAVDKIFFRARYNYQYILGKYSHALAQPMTDLDRFSRIAPYLLTKAMKLSGVSFMVLDREKHSFVVRAGEKETKGIEGLEVSEDSPLIQEILSRKRGISIEEMRYALRLGKDQRLESIISDMQRLKTVLIIPCVSESEYFKKPVLLSTINLGKKMSDENFSTEDIEFLRTLANQAAISIEYAFIMEELKRNQAAVVRSEKLAAIGTTTAGIAHELKNPLTYLNTLSQLMAKKWDDPEFKKSVADTLPAETQRMQMMVEGLLDYSREKEMQFKPVEIKEVVDKTLALLAYEIRKKSIEIKTDFSHQGVVSGDPNRLMQVFMNIVANAVQVMGAKGGEIIISTEEKADQVVVSIKDTGPGIAEENLKKIFDPFYSTKEGGTGLGLVITRKIVEEHKGSIEVESTPGQGTTFKISLPRA